MTAENTTNNQNPSEELTKDKQVLELILNNYYEQERRFNTIESKISSMITFIGVIFTIQATLFTNILIQLIHTQLFIKTTLSLFLIISLACYTYSLYSFVEAYYFGKYHSTPNPHDLYNKSKKMSESYIIKNLIYNIPDTIDKNEKSMQGKISKSKQGFKWFTIGSYSTLPFIIILIIYIMTI